MPAKHTGILDQEVAAKGELFKPALQSSRVRARGWWMAILRASRPSFLKLTSDQSTAPLRPTAYLDGLRGFAALLVYILHHELWAHSALMKHYIMENGYGYNNEWYLVTMPFIRNFFIGGHFAVSTFFVISGYVLSVKPLTLIHAGEYVKLADNLGSALFRRWFRLWVPIVIATFIYITVCHIFGVKGPHEIENKWIDEVFWWHIKLKNYSFAWRDGEPFFTYNNHIWSIPLEMKGSLLIYGMALSFMRFPNSRRMLCYGGLIWYFIYEVDGWFCALFTAGMALADLDIMAAKDQLPRWMTSLEPYQELIFYTMFLVAMFLAGVPCQGTEVQAIRDTPGWYYLSFLKPSAVFDPKWFYLFFASTFTVVCIPRLPWLKKFFESAFCQYLGRVSYMLYLVHGPVLWLLGGRMYAAVGYNREGLDDKEWPNWINKFPLPRFGPLGMEPNFLVCHVVLLPLTLWLADIGTKLIDDPVVKVAQKLYKFMLPPPNPATSPRGVVKSGEKVGA